jgi:hypothetical protein
MTQIQSVLFDREYYTPEQAINIIKKSKNFIFKKIDITKNKIRFRQHDPDYNKYHYITKNIPNKHMELIIGYEK